MYEVQDNTPENARQERRNRPREKKVSWEDIIYGKGTRWKKGRFVWA